MSAASCALMIILTLSTAVFTADGELSEAVKKKDETIEKDIQQITKLLAESIEFRERRQNSNLPSKPVITDVEPSKKEERKPIAPVVLIGNGPSILKHRRINGTDLGKLIDQFDEIGRFNMHSTKGFEKSVGSKTTICFMGQMKRPTRKKPHCPRYIVPVVKPKGQKLSRKDVMRDVKKWYKKAGIMSKMEIMPESVHKTLRREYGLRAGPSTGIQAIVYMVSKYKKIAIVGFDFLKGDHKHYFERKRKKRTTHDMKAEGKIIRKLEAQQKLVIL